ncbi:MAG: phosphoribosylformylglycinamidine synthase subunit PurQ [Methylacidiphilales bacterium]|nr:phosphoribosylformylglycinamidine synthase subunit PurQ [Candidatus Methylacidiphilales bacterium]
MRWAVIQFPGSNCDQDVYHVLKNVLAQEVDYVWHKDTSLSGADAVVVPGGFSYGDYLRCGAIARFSPVMSAVKETAAQGKTVLGICNGFQILCESGLLPGVLVRNTSLHFRCETIPVRVEHPASRFTSEYLTGQVLRLPIAHGEGHYVADDETLESLFLNKQVLFTYSDFQGRTTPESNPNGSQRHIAGIMNRAGNVLGLMPHPERASEKILGSDDGLGLFASILASQAQSTAKAA